MKRKNAARNALITSIISMLLCISMLVGTTFAWFTDEVTSGRNQIASGNLDVVLEYKNNWDDEWKPVDQDTMIFNDGALYEPGYTEVVFLRVSNAGSLALKYNLTVDVYEETPSTNVNDEEFKLSDYLQVGTYIQDEYSGDANYADILIPAMFGSREAALGSVTLGKLADFEGSLANASPLLPGDKTAQVVVMVLTMPETVGNEANHKTGVAAPQITLGVQLLATQYTHEEDSFDNQYDADASFPIVPGKFNITNNEELTQAFLAGGEGTVMNSFEEAYAELAEGTEFALNLNGMTLTGTDDNYVIVNRGTLSVTGDGTIASNLYGSIENWGNLVVDDLTLNVSGSKYGFHCKAGEVVIDDITLTAQRGGLNVQGGKVTINSGSITTTAYNTSIGYLVYAGAGEVVINGGDFRYEGAYNRHGVLYAGAEASIIVNGGTFGKGGSNTAKKPWLQVAEGGSIIIYGGTFEFDPSAFVAEGYQAVKGEDGWWTVSAVNAG